MNERIIVLGGCGYIGTTLVPLLLQRGYIVTVLDNLMYGQSVLHHCYANPRFNAERVDIRDIDQVAFHMKGADIIIPLAGLVGAPICNQRPAEAVEINLNAQLGIIAHASRDQRIIAPTTESSYGSNAEVCNEETVLNPLSTYALHKVQVEQALMEHGKACSLRLATVFGFSEKMRLDLLVNDFTWRALRDRAFVVFEGQYRRTCVHVQDVARAFVHALEGELQGIYNVGACTMTKLSLCEEIAKQVPGFIYTEAPMDKDPDQRNYEVTMAKIAATGFAPAWTLQAGIAELLKGYRMLQGYRHRNA